MKRFLIVLALVALGASLYVAAAPGSSKGTASLQGQVKILQKQMKTVQKQVKTLKNDLNGLGGFLVTCMAHAPVGVVQAGTAGTNGYLFGTSLANVPTTALDLAGSTTPLYQLFVLNTSNANCVTIEGQLAAHAKAGYLSRLALHR